MGSAEMLAWWGWFVQLLALTRNQICSWYPGPDAPLLRSGLQRAPHPQRDRHYHVARANTRYKTTNKLPMSSSNKVIHTVWSHWKFIMTSSSVHLDVVVCPWRPPESKSWKRPMPGLKTWCSEEGSCDGLHDRKDAHGSASRALTYIKVQGKRYLKTRRPLRVAHVWVFG